METKNLKRKMEVASSDTVQTTTPPLNNAQKKQKLLLTPLHNYEKTKKNNLPTPLCNDKKKQSRSIPTLEQHYTLGRELGSGMQGMVRFCKHKGTGKHFAVKSIRKTNNPEDEKGARLEIDIMKRLKGHPNIVNLEEVFEDSHFLHIVMELCNGGDLTDRIMSQGKFTEARAVEVFSALAQALLFCHESNILHRDIKPENIFLTSSSSSSGSSFNFKLGDFGLATYFSPCQRFTDVVGTPNYMAPEVKGKNYDKGADVWSLGVSLFVLLTGEFPLYDEGAIKESKPSLDDAGISADAKSLISQMLSKDADKRLSMQQVLTHRWVTSHMLQHGKSRIRIKCQSQEFVVNGNGAPLGGCLRAGL